MMGCQYSRIEENLKRIREDISRCAGMAGRNPDDIRLMAVTKTVPAELVNIAINHGVTYLGENRAQELTAKYNDYEKKGVSIHFIGKLQTNKVRQIFDKVDMIESLDSNNLALEIQKQAEKYNRTMNVLIEVNIGSEGSKSGIKPEMIDEMIGFLEKCPRLRLRGIMSIPPICDSKSEIEGYFDRLQQLFVDIKGKIVDNKSVDILSMGMSGDYREAVKHGSTLVRIGSALFGVRD